MCPHHRDRPRAPSDWSRIARFDRAGLLEQRAVARNDAIRALFLLHFCPIARAQTTPIHRGHMSSLRLTHLGPSLCTRRCIWSSACPLSLPRAAEMPQKKKTARGAHLAALNKQHPKREESAGDANDLEYVDKPDDSSSSG